MAEVSREGDTVFIFRDDELAADSPPVPILLCFRLLRASLLTKEIFTGATIIL